MMKDLKDILLTSLYFLLVLICIYVVITYVGQRVEVIGSSMYPTLENKDHMLVDKLSYRIKSPERFDIIVFPYKLEKNTHYIKRIIGMPGETVYIDEDGNIYIDGELLEESYGREVIQNQGLAYQPIVLGDDEYFVLGDNRNNSMDSRDPNVGNIKRSEITGRAFMRVFPIKRMGIIKHQ